MRNFAVHRAWWYILAAIIAVVAVLVAAEIARACPTCKDAVAGDPQHAGMVKGYFYSILFMMGMPFTLLGCFSLYMYNEVRKARAKQTVHREATPNERR